MKLPESKIYRITFEDETTIVIESSFSLKEIRRDAKYLGPKIKSIRKTMDNPYNER